jgi:folate-dependent phosphoribosylglycinamide formyltransferase PurN
VITPLYTPVPGRAMRVAAFMSGSGTNLIKILEHQKGLAAQGGPPAYEITVIVTDTPSSNASGIATAHNVPLVELDIKAFYRAHGRDSRRDLTLRPAFDRLIVERLAPFEPDTAVLAGYMSIVTYPLLEAFPGRMINVHPADLRITEGGRRKYTGDRAVADAILAGEPFLRASTHIVREEVDCGEVLMVSDPLPVELPQGITREELARPDNRTLLLRIASEHQDRLKRIGDWIILPRTLELMAQGRYALDGSGTVYLDGVPCLSAPEA